MNLSETPLAVTCFALHIKVCTCDKWDTGFFAVEVRKSTWERVVAIFRGYLTVAVRDVMDRGCDGVWVGG